MLGKLKILWLIILLLLMGLQLSPVGLGNNYDKYRVLIIAITGILLLLSFKLRGVLSVKIIRMLGITLVGETLLLGLLYVFGGKIIWGPLEGLFMAFVFLIISLNMHLTHIQYIKLINLFIWTTLFIGLTCVYSYTAGFVINDLYLPVPKNQIAPILAVGCFLSFFLGNYTKERWKRFYYWGMTFVLFLCICVFRARANIVAILIGLFVYFIFYKRKILVLFGSVLIGGAIVLLTPLGKFVYDAIFANYDISDLNSVSAGRTDIYMASLGFISDNFFLGDIYAGEGIRHQGTVHNYVLYILENYGIFGGGLLIFFYIKLFLEVVKSNVTILKYEFYHMGCFVFIVPLVVSLFEYTYPYAPGSAVFMAYFCLGQYYREIHRGGVDSFC